MAQKIVNPEVPLKINYDEIVKKINELVGDGLYKTAIEVGDYILDEFFDGNPVVAKSKSKDKKSTYRKLEDRADLKIHFSQLNQMVRVAIQEKYFDKKLSDDERNKLSYSHRIELLKLEDGAIKTNLAKKAIKSNLSVRQLRDEVAKKLPKPKISIAPFNASMKYLSDKQFIISIPDDKISDLSVNQLESTKKNIDSFVAKIETIKSEMEALKGKLHKELEEKNLSKNPITDAVDAIARLKECVDAKQAQAVLSLVSKKELLKDISVEFGVDLGEEKKRSDIEDKICKSIDYNKKLIDKLP